MTCTTMLDQMLEADLPELGGVGDSALAVHVRECPRCQVVANQLVRDTHELANMLVRSHRVAGKPLRRPRIASRRSRRIAAVGLAAVSFVTLRAWLPTVSTAARSPNATRMVAASSAASDEPTNIGAATPIAASAAPRHLPHRRERPSRAQPRGLRVVAYSMDAVRVDPVSAQPVSPAASVEPVRIDATAADAPLGNHVRADPPAGKRARVLRTANPDVTVVWLYESTPTGTQP